jgi:hypothetical protein
LKALLLFVASLYCCSSVLCPTIVKAEPPLFVGVIEDVEPGNLSPAMSSVHARVAFQKQGADWVPMKSDFDNQEALAHADGYFPATVNWTVVFDGKRIGTITSRNPGPPQGYGDVGTQIITSVTTDIPRIAAGASEFYYTGFRAKSRPLLLVSLPNFKDPEGWRPAALSVAERALAVREFRRKILALEQCKMPEDPSARMVPYSDHEILVIKAYRSRNGEVLFGQKLDDTRSGCEFFDDKNFFDYWFVANEKQVIRFLGSQMTPIDSADLDNNGGSEWVFKTFRGEDEDGYDLFYDNFIKKAAFHWTYH